MKNYTNLDKKLKRFKQSNIPSFIANDIDSLLKSTMSRQLNDIDFINVLNDGRETGRKEGQVEGMEAGIKSFLVGGEGQIFMTKTGEMYPFGNMEELYKSDEAKPYITEFLKEYAINEKLPPLESKYEKYMHRITENHKKSKSIPEIKEKIEKYLISMEESKLENIKFLNKSEEYILPEKLEHFRKNKEKSRANLIVIDNNIKIKKEELDNIYKIQDMPRYLELRPKRYQEEITNTFRSLGGSLNIDAISSISNLNELAIDKLKETIANQTPQKGSKTPKKSALALNESRLEERRELREKIKIYNTFGKIANIGKKIANTKNDYIDTIDNATIASLTNMFKEVKPGDTTLFLSEKFSILNVNQFRKIYKTDKKDGLTDIRTTVNDVYDNFDDSKIHDFRKNKIKYDRAIDYVQIPRNNMNLYEKKVNERFNGNIPDNIKTIMKLLENK